MASRLWNAVAETTKELSRDRIFWGEAGAAFVPWALNTLYQINYGQSPMPYTEPALHLLRGPVCARVARTLAKNYYGRELAFDEKLAYSTAGAALGAGVFEFREIITKHIPYLAKYTPSFDAVDTIYDTVFTVIGAKAEAMTLHLLERRNKSL